MNTRSRGGVNASNVINVILVTCLIVGTLVALVICGALGVSLVITP